MVSPTDKRGSNSQRLESPALSMTRVRAQRFTRMKTMLMIRFSTVTTVSLLSPRPLSLRPDAATHSAKNLSRLIEILVLFGVPLIDGPQWWDNDRSSTQQ